jgi:hypothetical protein
LTLVVASLPAAASLLAGGCGTVSQKGSGADSGTVNDGSGGTGDGTAGAAGAMDVAAVGTDAMGDSKVDAASAQVASSCLALLVMDGALADGVYMLDVDGNGPSPSLPYYCDMSSGGWTLVANQVPNAPLPDSTSSVNTAGIGDVEQSFRLGIPDISAIRPTTAWRLMDPSNIVYFKPTCTIDWTINYDTPTAMANDCTTGYTTLTFDTVVNGAWHRVSTRGIGINNSSASCSMRMYETHVNSVGSVEPGALQAGIATPCTYEEYLSQRVSLWFR